MTLYPTICNQCFLLFPEYESHPTNSSGRSAVDDYYQLLNFFYVSFVLKSIHLNKTNMFIEHTISDYFTFYSQLNTPPRVKSWMLFKYVKNSTVYDTSFHISDILETNINNYTINLKSRSR